ncbi:glycosyltransferase family 39 protein [Candidatus Bathyarchaeota archaeon]|nr:glycosyltransferase family 39 protein [Candidatus Bathyarchaeota archaeon]
MFYPWMLVVERRAGLIAFLLLFAMAGLAFLSMRDDSATIDEVPHIIAGYSYLMKQDYRLNPEHPPLLKDLAALPLVLMGLPFPDSSPYWENDVNGQWGLGRVFLYGSGNDADRILFWSRLPTVAMMLLLGIFLYKWSKERYGPKAGLLALVLYSFSPTVLAHGRYVTIDMGIAALTFIAFYYFWRYLEKPTRLNFGLAVLSFTSAQLSKFPAVLLIPAFILLIYLRGRSWRSLALLLLLSAVASTLFYQLHMLNMPLDVQHRLIETSISVESGAYAQAVLLSLLHSMVDTVVLRAPAQYLLGLAMVGGHAVGGHTNYFLGAVGGHHWQYYIVAYLLKEPLASQLLLLAAVWLTARRKMRPGDLSLGILSYCLLSLVVFSAFNTQLGIRYILPLFPFIYLLTSGQIAKYKGVLKLGRPLLIAWLAVSSLLVFPSYLAYYNELVGGPRNGYLYLVDSNADWGQDLKRLAQFVEENSISRIVVSYFGGGDPAYYLGEKYVPWEPAKGPVDGWFAVSESLYQSHRDDYSWLLGSQPVAQIGYSILVYNKTF